jgi:hypothetical protein
LSGNELLWARLSAFNSAFGFFATTGLNMSNFTVSNRIPYNHLYPCDNHLRDTRKTKGRTCNYDLIQTKLIISQSIYSTPSNSYWVHFGQLRRYCGNKCRCLPLRPSYLGPTQAH